MTPMPRLTFRKVSVLLHLGAGRGYKEIAAALDVHENTVRLHVGAIAALLPGDGAPKDKALLWCDRLLAANADVVAAVRRAA